MLRGVSRNIASSIALGPKSSTAACACCSDPATVHAGGRADSRPLPAPPHLAAAMFDPPTVNHAARNLVPCTPDRPPQWLDFSNVRGARNIYEATVRVDAVMGFTDTSNNPKFELTNHTYARGAKIEIAAMSWEGEFVWAKTKKDQVWIPVWRKTQGGVKMPLVFCTVEETAWEF